MPRVSPQHEQAVRDRIVRAAIGAFAEHGFHRATMQDVVRASGLSVGAIYTYFKSKSELILAGCDLITDQELGELRERLSTVTDFRTRISVALGYFFDQFEETRAGRGNNVLMTQAWAEADADPAIREMLRRRRRDIVTSSALLLQEGVIRGELPAWLDVESIAHAIAALLDGITLEAIEDGPAYRREDAERRTLGLLELLFAGRDAAAPIPRGCRTPAVRIVEGGPGVVTGVRVQTVRGPIEPAALGWVLPHEHTAISLWHVPNRWDYWELRRDEEVIVEELRKFVAVGGSAIVDLTLDGVGREAAWLVGVSEASGLHVVMGSGWYRDAYYPPEALIDRRSVDDLADEIVRDATVGVGDSGIRAGIIGEIGTDKPWISPREERVHRAAARAARRSGLAITTHAVQSTVGLDQLTVFEEEGADLSRVVIGHADSNPSSAYHRAIVERGATVEFDFLGMSFTPLERHGEGRIVESICELLAAGHGDRIMLSQDVCHDSQLTRYGGNGFAYLAETFIPRLRAAGVGDAEIRTMTVDNPRRLLTIG